MAQISKKKQLDRNRMMLMGGASVGILLLLIVAISGPFGSSDRRRRLRSMDVNTVVHYHDEDSSNKRFAASPQESAESFSQHFEDTWHNEDLEEVSQDGDDDEDFEEGNEEGSGSASGDGSGSADAEEE